MDSLCDGRRSGRAGRDEMRRSGAWIDSQFEIADEEPPESGEQRELGHDRDGEVPNEATIIHAWQLSRYVPAG